MHRVRTAVIGYGLGGRTFHVPLISAVAGFELAAIVTSQADRVHAEWPGVDVRPDVEAVFTDPSIELVVVSTPNDSHFDVATRAYAAGKHVVVDKPFTVTTAEAEGIMAAATAAERVLSVFHNRRWDADFLTLQRLLQEDALGDVSLIESHYDRFRPVVRDRWREHDVPGAGTWYDLGAHIADQVLRLWGPPASITADLVAQRPGATAIDYFHVVLAYSGGRRAILHGGSMAAAASTLRFVVHGRSGSYIKYGLDTQEASLKAGNGPGSPDYGIDPVPGELTAADGSVTRVRNERGNYAAYYEELLRALRDDTPPPVSGEDGLAVMRVIEAGRRSASTKRTIDLDAR